jgi:predicted N-acyltransferase
VSVRIARSLGDVGADAWNALDADATPFLRHEFLLALESTGCATPATGWHPHHLLHHDASGNLAGAMPLYLKDHSWGEFVFDFAWADAWQRAGFPYYPRLVAAVPFTPATGPRLLAPAESSRRALLVGARELGRELAVSSLHVLFPDPRDRALMKSEGMLPRLDCQFHWHNLGYACFDDFLDGFTAEKRKKVRRERRRVAEAGIECRTVSGRELDAKTLATVYRLHALTFARYGNAPYLNLEFFHALARRMPDALVVELATHHGEIIACAVSLQGRDTLYGRYWGASVDHHSLHFELCYYRGIEHCIRAGLGRFEPGTQGEHKLLRGFVPAPVWSMHDIADPGFAAAVGQWLRRERSYRRAWFENAMRHLPFRRAGIPARLSDDVRDCLAAED